MPVKSISTDLRNAFLTSSPPRIVPQEISQRIIPGWETLTRSLAGGVFLFVGLVLSWFFVPRHLPEQWRLDKGPVEIVPGEILTVEDTRTTVNKSRVWKYEFVFRTQGGAEQKGIAHTPGKQWEAGAPAEVRYLISDPRIAVPVGATLDAASAMGCVVLVFPLLGLYIVLHSLFERRWKKRLLRDGLVGEAVVNSLEKSILQSNGQNFYTLRMTRGDDGIPIQKRIHMAEEINVAEAKLKSGEPLTLLYDRNKPKRFFIVESWDADAGGIRPERFFREYAVPVSTPFVSPVAELATNTFLEEPAPRRVPRQISKKAAPLGGMFMFQLFGMAFLVFGLFAVWRALGESTTFSAVMLIFPLIGFLALFGPVFLRSRDLRIVRMGTVATASITSVEKTTVKINEQCQYKIHLTRDDDGFPMVKRTHRAKEIAFAMRKWRDGEPVKILYLPDNPKRFLMPESWNE